MGGDLLSRRARGFGRNADHSFDPSGTYMILALWNERPNISCNERAARALVSIRGYWRLVGEHFRNTMRTAALILTLVFVTSCTRNVSDSVMAAAKHDRNMSIANATNRMAPAQAIKIASGLRIGMKEAEAAHFLERHGITSCIVDTNGEILVYSFSVVNDKRVSPA
jgi:hypothetical protein